jgi:hypothetical protein
MSMSAFRQWLSAGLCCVLGLIGGLMSTGCTQSLDAGLPTTSVGGTITLDGIPAIGAQIRFLPLSGTKGFGATATADEHGQFTVSSPDGLPEVPFGEYKVLVQTYLPPEDPEVAKTVPAPNGKPTVIPRIYGDEGTTPLTALVTYGSKSLALELKSR